MEVSGMRVHVRVHGYHGLPLVPVPPVALYAVLSDVRGLPGVDRRARSGAPPATGRFAL